MVSNNQPWSCLTVGEAACSSNSLATQIKVAGFNHRSESNATQIHCLSRSELKQPQSFNTHENWFKLNQISNRWRKRHAQHISIFSHPFCATKDFFFCWMRCFEGSERERERDSEGERREIGKGREVFCLMNFFSWILWRWWRTQGNNSIFWVFFATWAH